jgi:hypothetical protein
MLPKTYRTRYGILIVFSAIFHMWLLSLIEFGGANLQGGARGTGVSVNLNITDYKKKAQSNVSPKSNKQKNDKKKSANEKSSNKKV